MTELSFDSLPLWQGVQERTGVVNAFSFSLKQGDGHFISQTTDASVSDQVIAAYADDTYSFITPPPGQNPWSNRLGQTQFDFITACDIAEDCRSALEIGGATDFLAERIRKDHPGIDYTVVDPTARTEASGDIEHIADYFPAAALENRQFDLILSFNCLEHVASPNEFLASLRSLLKPGTGRAIISFPDTEQQLRDGDLNVLSHEHLSYFTQDSSRRLFRTFGLDIVEMRSFEDSIWIHAAPCENETMPVSPPTDDLLGITRARIDLALKERLEMIERALSDGRKVAFHGATNGLNNFCHLTRLTGRSGLSIFDCDGDKAGRFLPTLPEAIRDCHDPLYGEFDIVFVSAMTFFDEVKDFLQSRHNIPAAAIVPLFPAEGEA